MEKKVPKFIPKAGQMDYTKARWAPVLNAVLNYKDKILIVERNSKMNLYPGYWNGISGFLDDNRSLEEKVKDELREEIGLNENHVLSIKLCGIFDQEDFKLKKTWIVHALLVTVDTDEVKLDWEGQNHEWINPKDIKKYKLMPGFDKVLKIIIPNLRKGSL